MGDPPRPGGGQAGRVVEGGAVYIVKTGDTLPGIARKTGVSIERIRELNPELDPLGLFAGQRIKLRE